MRTAACTRQVRVAGCGLPRVAGLRVAGPGCCCLRAACAACFRQNCEKNFQIAAGSSDQVVCPPENKHHVVGTSHPWYSTQPFGVTGCVWVPQWFLAAYRSKNALPSEVATNVSASPWKAMMGRGAVLLLS